MEATVEIRGSKDARPGTYPHHGRRGLAAILVAVALLGTQIALMAAPATAAAAGSGTTTAPPDPTQAKPSPTTSPATPASGTVPTPPMVQEAQANAAPPSSASPPSLDATQLVTPPDLGPPKQAAELVDRRTATTKTFATDRPGAFVTESSAAPVHFRDPQGRWQDIDTTLAPAKDGRLHTKATGFDLSVASDATDASVASLGLDASHSVGFALEGAAKTKGKASKDDTTFSSARKDTELRLTSRRNGLKEDLVLASPAAPDRFVFPLKLKGLTAAIDANGDVVYRDESGAERARTPHGFMADANVDPRSGEAATSLGVHFALIPSGKGGTALEVTLDRAWMNDPARVYPVTVDPEFITATAADDTYVMSGFSRDNSSDAELKVGTYDGGYHIGRTYLHFNTDPVRGKVIQWGRLDIAESWSWNCDAGGPTPYRVTQGWDGRTMTDWPGAAIDVPAGGQLVPAGGDCPNRTFTADMNGASANWASGAWNNLGIALLAPSEGDNNYYKKFASLETGAPPALHVGWTEPATPPSAPQNVVATARNGSASVSWAPPANNGGAAVDSYIVYAYSYPSGAYANTYAYVCATCVPATVPGLANGQQYYFVAYAHNAVNWGGGAVSNVVVPTPQPPGPPRSPSATPRNRSAIVSWVPPADNGGTPVDYYGVFAYSYPSYTYLSYTQGCATCTSVTVPNLTNGQQYYFAIYAHNAVNWGPGVGANVVTPTITTPGAPTTVIAAPGSSSATVAWSAITDDGGAAMDASYILAYTTSPSLAYANRYAQVCATCTSGTVTGLTNGIAYQFIAFGHNSLGNGAYTWSNIVTPGASPDLLTPTSVVAAPGDTQAQLTWVAPITHILLPVSYTITTYKASDNTQLGTTSVPATSIGNVTGSVTGLANGVAVYFRVTATSLIFLTSPLSQPSNTVNPFGRPFAPEQVYADPGDHSAVVHWLPPSPRPDGTPGNNGSPITGYQVVTATGGQPVPNATAASDATSLTIGNLFNGKSAYRFTVQAINAAGAGIASASTSPVVPAGSPFQPQFVTANVLDSTQVSLSWIAPQTQSDGTPADNGSAIRWYTVLPSPACGACLGTSVPADDMLTLQTTVRGLAPGTTYRFRVVATNGIGDSAPSDPSDPVSTPSPNPPPPPGFPGPASGVTVTFGDTTAQVSWAPGDSGRSPILDYTVRAIRPDGSEAGRAVVSGTTTTASFTGLSNTTAYLFFVNARTAVGTSTLASSSPGSLRGTADSLMMMPLADFAALRGPGPDGHGPAPFDWSSDGCSGGIFGQLLPPSFLPACYRHDFGYRNYGNGLKLSPTQDTRYWIDQNLLRDLLNTCDSSFAGAQRTFCRDKTAHVVYDFVRAFGNY